MEKVANCKGLPASQKLFLNTISEAQEKYTLKIKNMYVTECSIPLRR